ncbi:DUF4214 domain-containing protein, partial [Sulfitobacter mediterraneus]|uniref:DUF4214 domain-containing protein n=1 Tax=Sulfitobacter mediterraneus TaxID=83219 RepID=UPI00055CF7E4
EVLVQPIIGDAGDNNLVGGNADDTLSGGAGNDTLEGGEGSDRFDINPGDEIVEIVDFELGNDILDLIDFLREEALEAFFNAQPGSAILTFADGTALRVDGEGVSPETLTINDVAFADGNLSATGAPIIIGDAAVGELLTLDVSSIDDRDGFDPAQFSYQWLRGNQEISGATGSNYLLVEDDLGSEISVGVSFVDFFAQTETLISMSTTAVEPAAPPNSAPVISGFDGIKVLENSPFGTVASTILASDAEGDQLTYALTDAESLPFAIVGQNIVVSGALDHEEQSFYQLSVSVTDEDGATSNNTVLMFVEDVPEAELNVGGTGWSRDVQSGELPTFSLQVRNSGTVEASPFQVDIHLSVDETLSVDDILVGQVLFEMLAPGNISHPVSANIALPEGTPLGDYTYLVTIDAQNDVVETNEHNNFYVGPSTSVTQETAKFLFGNGLPNTLVGGDSHDELTGQAGNDILIGKEGNDFLHGGSGIDMGRFEGNQSSYTLTLTPTSTTIADRREPGQGTDQLSSIELLDFDQNIPLFGENPFNLDIFDGPATLNPAEFANIIELYIAYFSRAPDALGLFYWATQYTLGFSVPMMAENFFGQPETKATYASVLDDQGNLDLGDLAKVGEFVTAVYDNVLGRAPDGPGFDYWTNQLINNPDITPDIFILAIINGAKFPSEETPQTLEDQVYLETKGEIGAYFSVIKGMSDIENSATAMGLYDGTETSLTAAVTQIDAFYADALDPITGEFLMALVGVIDDPFTGML